MTTKQRRIVVAINPSASFGSSRDVGPAVVQTLRAMGHEVTSLTEPDFDSLYDAAMAAVRGKADALVVVGGDGMVNLAVNVLAGTKVALGIVPSGTGNDMARGLAIPHDDTEAAIRALGDALQREPRTIDVGRIRWTEDDAPFERLFAGSLSAGWDAIVNDRANRMRRPKGASRYMLAMLAELLTLSPLRYRVTLDGETLDERALLVSVGNNTSLGGGMRFAPDALLDDGELDVMIVRPLSRIAFLRIFPRVFSGAHTSDPRVVMRRAKRIRIEVDAPITAYADGERIGPMPVDIEVVPGALRVLV
ncbi:MULTISPECIES: YegS/Rv2252/BmrU family lipid kinase [unclassified Salinibacterium]|uniref:diacylglycerol/lipid kinase family protein n=1 Tax=unclassified Salinibacterium TaxID=2632331 RepID=UPI0014213CEE|nr:MULTISPECIES: YegS/Rv2252/BmrU family lipid kinase [unclassified Salinibacterium]